MRKLSKITCFWGLLPVTLVVAIIGFKDRSCGNLNDWSNFTFTDQQMKIFLLYFTIYANSSVIAQFSTKSASVSLPPTFPGKTTYGTPPCLDVGSSHIQSGTPGAA
jgi:hypothetical protein